MHGRDLDPTFRFNGVAIEFEGKFRSGRPLLKPVVGACNCSVGEKKQCVEVSDPGKLTGTEGQFGAVEKALQELSTRIPAKRAE